MLGAGDVTILGIGGGFTVLTLSEVVIRIGGGGGAKGANAGSAGARMAAVGTGASRFRGVTSLTDGTIV